MEPYFAIVMAINAVALIGGFLILGLQVGAWHQHRHRCFALLWLGTCGGLVTVVLSVLPSFVRLEPPVLLRVTAFSGVLYGLSTVLSLVGTASLFRSYARLMDATNRDGGQAS